MLGGHRLEIGILRGVRLVEGIDPHVDLPAVGQAVAIGVPVDGVGAEDELLEVREAVEIDVRGGFRVDSRIE